MDDVELAVSVHDILAIVVAFAVNAGHLISALAAPHDILPEQPVAIALEQQHDEIPLVAVEQQAPMGLD